MTNDPSEIDNDICHHTLTPVCRLCGYTGPTLLLAAEQGRIRAVAAGTQHVIDHHRAAPRAEEAFQLVAFVITVPADRHTGIEPVQAALDRANARNLLAQSH